MYFALQKVILAIKDLCYNRAMISLIAFLGNYGNEYAKTRHNVAWLFADSLPFNWQQKFRGQYASVDYSTFLNWISPDKRISAPKNCPEKLYFLKPETYMNLSGESIGELARFFKIKPEEILVVHDEVELPLGTYSLKWSGGLAGHNGLRSTKTVLGTADFWRLRFGIDKPSNGDVANHVLGAFTSDQMITLSIVFTVASELLNKVLTASDAQHLLPEWAKKKI